MNEIPDPTHFIALMTEGAVLNLITLFSNSRLFCFMFQAKHFVASLL